MMTPKSSSSHIHYWESDIPCECGAQSPSRLSRTPPEASQDIEYTVEELMEKYKKHAYEGEVEQTIDYLDQLITTSANKARRDELEELATIYRKNKYLQTARK